jgi:hypothetical protein
LAWSVEATPTGCESKANVSSLRIGSCDSMLSAVSVSTHSYDDCMSTVPEASARERVIAAFRELVDALQELPLGPLADAELLDLVRDIEVEHRRLQAVDHRLVSEIDLRRLAFERGCRNTVTLLSTMLRIDAAEASARVAAAQNLGPRVSQTGERLDPIFPAVAAALEAGEISPAHARIVTNTIDALPADVQTRRGVDIERTLVGEARKFAPRDLRIIARRLRDTYDQDGRLADDDDRARQRFLDLREHADGTVSGSFHTDAETGQALLAAIDAGSKPRPAADGTPDPRPARQRRHDALREVVLLALRTGELPRSGGVTTTVVLTMTAQQYDRARCAHDQTEGPTVGRPRGPTDEFVRTARGALMSLKQVAPLLGDAQILPVVVSRVRGIEAYGTTHRIFTESQRLAMGVRDRGCSFPGCSVPPAWCEVNFPG